MAEVLTHEFRARSPRAVVIVAVAVALMLGLVAVFDAALWLIFIFAAIATPAVVDIVVDRRATFRMDDETIEWSSGRRQARISLKDIQEVKLRTAMDVSQRARLLLVDGTRVKIPIECIPPGRALDEAFEARGIPNRRSLF